MALGETRRVWLMFCVAVWPSLLVAVIVEVCGLGVAVSSAPGLTASLESVHDLSPGPWRGPREKLVGSDSPTL